MTGTADSTDHSRIGCDIDLAADGKQCGFLRLPHSVHRSAYGWLPVPIAQLKNGTGPQVLLMAGNHGDEYEGQIALTKLIQKFSAEKVRGRIVILPMANFAAAEAGLRTSPIDGGNLNRSFPGDPDGSPTLAMAHFIERALMPGMDTLIDLHSGGSSLHYLPAGLGVRTGDADWNRRQCELLAAFATPLALLFSSDGEDRMSSSAARRQGLLPITVEMGGSGTISAETQRLTDQGLERALVHLGCLEGPAQAPATATRFMEVGGGDYFCHATENGVFEPFVELGELVRAGQPAGAIHTPETPWREPIMQTFGREGLVVCRRVPARTRRGDCLFHLASEVSAADAP